MANHVLCSRVHDEGVCNTGAAVPGRLCYCFHTNPRTSLAYRDWRRLRHWGSCRRFGDALLNSRFGLLGLFSFELGFHLAELLLEG